MSKTETKPALGTGVYTYRDAADLLHVRVETVRRWVEGYRYHGAKGPRESKSILQSKAKDVQTLTFHDLVELWYVRAFRKAGVDLPQIKRVAESLAEKWSVVHPFSLKKILIDGRRLALDDIESFVDAQTTQRAFEYARPYMKNVDFDDRGVAIRWWPSGHEGLIVLDPGRSFGAPIVAESGVRTDTLYKTFKQEGDVDNVAAWYDVKPEEVVAAIRFEEEWLAAA